MTGIAIGVSFLTGAALGWWAGLLAAVAGVVVVAGGGGRRLVVPTAVAIAALTLGAWRGVPPPDPRAPPWVDQASAVRGRVATATSNGRGQQIRIEVDAARLRAIGTWIDAAGCLRASLPLRPTVRPGDRVLLAGAIEPVGDQRSAFRSYLRSQGCGGAMVAGAAVVLERGTGWRSAFAAARADVTETLARAAPGDAGALLAGLVTGDDATLSPARQEAFLRTGTTHLTAVSGSNIALVLAIFATLGASSGWRRRLIWQVVTIGAVWGYAGLVGLQPPATRAAVVAMAAVLASRTGRRADYVTLVVLAGAALVAVEPADLWTLSFQLSFASSLALAAVLPALRPVGPVGWIGAALLATMVAQVATIPTALPAFRTLSLVSVAANLVVGPLVEVLFPLAALVGVVGLVAPTAAEALAVPARLAATAVFWVTDGLAGVPLAVIDLPFLGGRLPRFGLGAVAAIAVTVASRDGRRWIGRDLGSAR